MSLLNFPYGRAPLVLLVMAIVSGLIVFWRQQTRQEDVPDLVFAIFAPNHEETYRLAIADFEREHGVRVQLQLVDMRALQSRLQSALQTGARVPDMVELESTSMGFFTRGPLDDVGFVDLTDRLHAEGLYDQMVESRYSLWSSRGRIFALPHDVHPVALAYRRDLVEELGIDVAALKTWDDFAEMGRRVTADLTGDGYPDRYAIDLVTSGASSLQILLLQRGGMFLDEHGEVAFDSPEVVDTILWHLEQSVGPHPIAYDVGWGQSLARAMHDGLVLFYFCPDWRTRQFEMDLPGLEGRMALMPLPAWEEGGRRTSTWGGTGLAITRASEQQELAWELAKHLYLKADDLADRFRGMNIVPPLMDSWDLEAFQEPRPYWSGQAIGALYAELSPETPPLYSSPYQALASGAVSEVYLSAVHYVKTRGESGLRAFVETELAKKAEYVRRVAGRNVFLQEEQEKALREQ